MKNTKKIKLVIPFMLVMFFTMGLTTTYGQDDKDDKDDKEKKEKKEKTPEEIAKQKEKIQQGKSKGLKELYEIEPSAKGKIAKAYGYAVFTNTGVNLFVLSSGNGKGVAINNSTGKQTYMKMISYGAGVGIGLKSYYGIFIFDNKIVFNEFLEKGWSADAQADATADTGEEGGSVSTAMNVAPGVILYQIADKGFAAQATVQGTKFIVDDELNN